MNKSEKFFNKKELSGMAIVFLEDLETMNHKTLEDVEEVSLKIQYKDSDGFYRIDVEDFLTELEKLKI